MNKKILLSVLFLAFFSFLFFNAPKSTLKKDSTYNPGIEQFGMTHKTLYDIELMRKYGTDTFLSALKHHVDATLSPEDQYPDQAYFNNSIYGSDVTYSGTASEMDETLHSTKYLSHGNYHRLMTLVFYLDHLIPDSTYKNQADYSDMSLLAYNYKIYIRGNTLLKLNYEYKNPIMAEQDYPYNPFNDQVEEREIHRNQINVILIGLFFAVLLLFLSAIKNPKENAGVENDKSKNKRKILLRLLISVPVLSLLIIAAFYEYNFQKRQREEYHCKWEESKIYDDFEYSLYDDGETTVAQITFYLGNDLFVTIPDEIEGYPVTAITPGTFLSKPVVSVHLGANVYDYWYDSFENCTSLFEITGGANTDS